MRICSAASELRCGETKTTKIRRLDHATIIANGLATYLQFHFFVYLTQVSYFNLSLKLSYNLSDFMFFPKLYYTTGCTL